MSFAIGILLGWIAGAGVGLWLALRCKRLADRWRQIAETWELVANQPKAMESQVKQPTDGSDWT